MSTQPPAGSSRVTWSSEQLEAEAPLPSPRNPPSESASAATPLTSPGRSRPSGGNDGSAARQAALAGFATLSAAAAAAGGVGPPASAAAVLAAALPTSQTFRKVEEEREDRVSLRRAMGRRLTSLEVKLKAAREAYDKKLSRSGLLPTTSSEDKGAAIAGGGGGGSLSRLPSRTRPGRSVRKKAADWSDLPPPVAVSAPRFTELFKLFNLSNLTTSTAHLERDRALYYTPAREVMGNRAPDHTAFVSSLRSGMLQYFDPGHIVTEGASRQHGEEFDLKQRAHEETAVQAIGDLADAWSKAAGFLSRGGFQYDASARVMAEVLTNSEPATDANDGERDSVAALLAHVEELAGRVGVDASVLLRLLADDSLAEWDSDSSSDDDVVPHAEISFKKIVPPATAPAPPPPAGVTAAPVPPVAGSSAANAAHESIEQPSLVGLRAVPVRRAIHRVGGGQRSFHEVLSTRPHPRIVPGLRAEDSSATAAAGGGTAASRRMRGTGVGSTLLRHYQSLGGNNADAADADAASPSSFAFAPPQAPGRAARGRAAPAAAALPEPSFAPAQDGPAVAATAAAGTAGGRPSVSPGAQGGPRLAALTPAIGSAALAHNGEGGRGRTTMSRQYASMPRELWERGAPGARRPAHGAPWDYNAGTTSPQLMAKYWDSLEAAAWGMDMDPPADVAGGTGLSRTASPGGGAAGPGRPHTQPSMQSSPPRETSPWRPHTQPSTSHTSRPDGFSPHARTMGASAGGLGIASRFLDREAGGAKAASLSARAAAAGPTTNTQLTAQHARHRRHAISSPAAVEAAQQLDSLLASAELGAGAAAALAAAAIAGSGGGAAQVALLTAKALPSHSAPHAYVSTYDAGGGGTAGGGGPAAGAATLPSRPGFALGGLAEGWGSLSRRTGVMDSRKLLQIEHETRASGDVLRRVEAALAPILHQQHVRQGLFNDY